MRLGFRVFWRICALCLVVGAAYVTTFVIFPYFDQRLPFFPAVLLGYIVLAYFLLPMASRFWRVVFKPNHIPRYVVTPDGWPSDPVNIAVVAKNKRHFVRIMNRAGWHTADKATLYNAIREGWAILTDKPYPTAPFSALYLFGRNFDIGFQKSTLPSGSPRHRHHVRFWQLIDKPEHDTHGHYHYWLARLGHMLGRRKCIWIGAALEDTSSRGIRWRNLQITHLISPDHTLERDTIISSLKAIDAVDSIQVIRDGKPFVMRGQNIGRKFIVDGNISVVVLK